MIGGILKIIGGLILIVIGLWLILPASWFGLGLWDELWIVLKGTIPAFLVLMGILLVWIEAEELKG